MPDMNDKAAKEFMDIRRALARITEGRDLDLGEMQAVMGQIMTGEATSAQIAGFLVALRMKGETVEEIAGAVRYLLESPSVTGQMLTVDGGQHLAWETPDVVGINE